MLALNLLIFPILLILGLELFGFIHTIQRYRSPKLTLALFVAMPLLNFGLYEGALALWPDSWLDKAEHEVMNRKAMEEGASQGNGEAAKPAAVPPPAPPAQGKPQPVTPSPAPPVAVKPGHTVP